MATSVWFISWFYVDALGLDVGLDGLADWYGVDSLGGAIKCLASVPDALRLGRGMLSFDRSAHLQALPKNRLAYLSILRQALNGQHL